MTYIIVFHWGKNLLLSVKQTHINLLVLLSLIKKLLKPTRKRKKNKQIILNNQNTVLSYVMCSGKKKDGKMLWTYEKDNLSGKRFGPPEIN